MTHVLAARCDSAGDVLLQGPALRALRAGADRLTLLCGPRGRAAAELLPGVDEVVVWHTPWIDALPEPVNPPAVTALVDRVRALAVDEAVIFTSFHQSPLPLALLLRLAGVARCSATSVDFPGSLLDVRHRIGDDVHEVERSLALARAAGFPLPSDDDGALRVVPSHDVLAPASTGASSGYHDAGGHLVPGALRGAPYVVIHPGASVPARAWAPERHAELVDRLVASGRRVAVTGGPDERALTARVAGDRGLDLGGELSFAALADVLAGADAVVVGNTGPAHLAAAVGTPVVSLFAPTVPAVRWRPWRVAHELVFVDVPCAGCRAQHCPVPGHPCLDDVAPGAVLAALERLAPAAVAA